ncbi:sigma-54-dependent Fis family transcriptional regulator [Treponema pedis]|uniref:sigma-54-dependent Fis family transcriptional regulator n=1 Tax=Treponema pedis TaxID=409322 RepID=UPI0003FE33F8|nr:sigma 54-interacting transcriptional regulator [Treponema pedis]
MGTIDSIKRDKLNTLINTGLLINSNYSDLSVLLEKIVESAMMVVEGDAASLLMREEGSEHLRFEIAIGPKGIEAKKIVIGMNGIAGWVIKYNKSVIINDVEHDPRFDSTVQDVTGYKNRNMLAVPMRIKDKCIGVIEVLNKVGGKDFDTDDLNVLELFANQTAIAYQNARHYNKSREEIICLQDQLKQDKGYHTLIAKSPVMLEKLELCKNIAASDASVLILGESGVGKELIAEQLHLHSRRVNEPFIRVNCAALPDGLLESELFGHVRGAFTDAVSDRVGRFELANRGTIFLDEIGDIPLQLQTKLLRVLQEMQFERVGSNKTITIDTRIITATNKNIEELVAQGKFRSDLYYRLNVLPIYIPPLRNRREDIPELADFFLKRFGKEMKKSFLGFSADAMNMINTCPWHGNIRELENAVERACVLGTPPYIERKDLFIKLGDEPALRTVEVKPKDLKTAVNDFKKNHITGILEKCRWNQTAAAEILDIQRTYLSRLIKELEIKEN